MHKILYITKNYCPVMIWQDRKEVIISRVNSKQKGARFERQLASKFREYGYNCRRGQQYCGANGDADVVGLPGIHIEAKHQEKMYLYDWMAQAKADARPEEIPAVFHKKNNADILVTLSFDDFIKLYREYEAGMFLQNNNTHAKNGRKEENNETY